MLSTLLNTKCLSLNADVFLTLIAWVAWNSHLWQQLLSPPLEKMKRGWRKCWKCVYLQTNCAYPGPAACSDTVSGSQRKTRSDHLSTPKMVNVGTHKVVAWWRMSKVNLLPSLFFKREEALGHMGWHCLKFKIWWSWWTRLHPCQPTIKSQKGGGQRGQIYDCLQHVQIHIHNTQACYSTVLHKDTESLQAKGPDLSLEEVNSFQKCGKTVIVMTMIYSISNTSALAVVSVLLIAAVLA